MRFQKLQNVTVGFEFLESSILLALLSICSFLIKYVLLLSSLFLSFLVLSPSETILHSLNIFQCFCVVTLTNFKTLFLITKILEIFVLFLFFCFLQIEPVFFCKNLIQHDATCNSLGMLLMFSIQLVLMLSFLLQPSTLLIKITS